MSHKNKESLVSQVQKTLNQRLAIGESKFDAKRVVLEDGRRLSDTKIYSWSTYRTYMKHCNYFAAWCKENYGCRTLEQCRAHIDEWVQSRVESCSPYTVKMEVSALAKLYDCTVSGYAARGTSSVRPVTNVETPTRARADIIRSRGAKAMDRRFSESRNAELVGFCRATGLRRSELEHLRGNQLYQRGEDYYIRVQGKGGRWRDLPVVGNVALVVDKCTQAGESLVWGRVHAAMDVHSYRAEYATAIYKAHERPLEALKGRDRYICRGDRVGTVYDRQALRAASQALGHNRESVVAGHYLYRD